MKNQNGITLVALVITIIILLILAGITIAALQNVNLFSNARRAVNVYSNKQQEEDTIVDGYDSVVQNYIEQLTTKETPTENP